MAANSSTRAFTSFRRNRFFNQIWNSNTPLSLSSRRAAYSSVYDKNVEDHTYSGAVPDDVIQATQSTNYWGPHPQTGVFGPPGDQATPLPGGDRSFHSGSPTDASAAANSVLEEKAWFRPTSLEDLEKPHPHP